MTDNRCTEPTYLKAWRREILQGVAASKLTLQTGRADIKTVSVPSDSSDYRQKDDAE